MHYQVSAELLQRIDSGASWMVVNKESNVVIDAYSKRDDARAIKGSANKLVQFQAGSTDLVVEKQEGELQKQEGAQLNGEQQRDEAFDNPHHGHPDPEAPKVDEPKEPQPPLETDAKPIEPKPADGKPAADKPAKPDILRKSEVEKPTRLVHVIADMLYDADPNVARKDIITACTAQGIAYNTILTQYQAWRSNREAKSGDGGEAEGGVNPDGEVEQHPDGEAEQHADAQSEDHPE